MLLMTFGTGTRTIRATLRPFLAILVCMASVAHGQQLPTPDSNEAVRRAAARMDTNQDGFQEATFSDGTIMVQIPAGPFTMGRVGERDAEPEREVTLDAFWIGKFPVTVAQFRAFVEATGYRTDAEHGAGAWQWNGWAPETPDEDRDAWDLMADGRWNNIYFEQGDDHPVGSVSWNDAQAYCAWLAEGFGLPFTLPTEAQWEKAARGDDGRVFPWGNESPTGRHANLADLRFMSKYGHARQPDPGLDDGYVETSPVDAYPLGRSPYGVYDLAGNLGEWVYDIYDRDYYSQAPDANPRGPARPDGLSDAEIDRVNRGGSWVDRAGDLGTEGGHTILSYQRTGDEQNSADDHMGFRIAIDFRSRSPKPDLEGVEIIRRHVRGSVYMLQATGDVAGNVAALPSDRGTLLVDTQFVELASLLRQSLEEIDAEDVTLIVNTHHHDDHAEGNARFGPGAAIIGSLNLRDRFLGAPAHARPTITFENELTLYWGDETVRLVHFPNAHTDSDVVVHFVTANVFHLGDLFNAGTTSFPSIDLESGGSLQGLVTALAELLEVVPDDARIIPGHYAISDRNGLGATYRMIVETAAFVRGQIESGRSVEETVELGLPAPYDSWGLTGYTSGSAWIENLYSAIQANGDAPRPE